MRVRDVWTTTRNTGATCYIYSVINGTSDLLIIHNIEIGFWTKVSAGLGLGLGWPDLSSTSHYLCNPHAQQRAFTIYRNLTMYPCHVAGDMWDLALIRSGRDTELRSSNSPLYSFISLFFFLFSQSSNHRTRNSYTQTRARARTQKSARTNFTLPQKLLPFSISLIIFSKLFLLFAILGLLGCRLILLCLIVIKRKQLYF